MLPFSDALMLCLDQLFLEARIAHMPLQRADTLKEGPLLT